PPPRPSPCTPLSRSVRRGHLQVQDGDVRPVLGGEPHRLGGGGGLGHHREVGLQLQQRGQGAPEQALVVGDQQPDHSASALASIGSRADTVNPPPSRRQVSSPPAASSRPARVRSPVPGSAPSLRTRSRAEPPPAR